MLTGGEKTLKDFEAQVRNWQNSVKERDAVHVYESTGEKMQQRLHIEQNNPKMDVTGAHGRLFAHPVRVSMSLATPAMLARSTKLRDR